MIAARVGLASIDGEACFEAAVRFSRVKEFKAPSCGGDGENGAGLPPPKTRVTTNARERRSGDLTLQIDRHGRILALDGANRPWHLISSFFHVDIQSV